jgi:hypothetical protein
MNKIISSPLALLKNLFNFRSKPEAIRYALIRSSFLNLLARGFGYLKHLSIAILLGFSSQTDAVFMALSLLGVFLIFADVFDSIGVPNLVSARLKGEEEFKILARSSLFLYLNPCFSNACFIYFALSSIKVYPHWLYD